MTQHQEQVQATFRGSAQKVRKIVEQSSLSGGGDPYHGDLYINIGDEELRTIAGSSGHVVVSYSDFGEEYLDTIEGETEAVIDVGDFLNYLDIATEGGMVEVSFVGDDESRLAQQLTIDGKLNSTIMLPGSQAVLEEVPLGLPKQFNDNNVMTNSEGEPLGTHISTDVDELSTIVDAVDLREDVEFYPVVVEEGSFRLDVGDEKSQEVRGALDAVVEPTTDETDEVDVDNQYNEGFEELVGALSGDVNVYTTQDAPLCVTQEGAGRQVRHSLGNVG